MPAYSSARTYRCNTQVHGVPRSGLGFQMLEHASELAGHMVGVAIRRALKAWAEDAERKGISMSAIRSPLEQRISRVLRPSPNPSVGVSVHLGHSAKQPE